MVFHEGMCQFKRDSGTTEIVKVPPHFRIDQCCAIRTSGMNFMVIEDHYIYPPTTDFGDFFCRISPTIYCNEKVRTVFLETPLNTYKSKAISFFRAPWQKALRPYLIGRKDARNER